ncbi:di-trans,poly-cis-decaprenylcistransferase [bacterium]|nr:di-trans,poly-cis-decaprenylcistransferase [bacterium]
MPESEAELYSRIDGNHIPRHVGIIMDGNGRWGKKYGFARVIGHREGVETVRMVVETSLDIGVKHLSLFAFSSENIFRPLMEVNSLFGLFEEILDIEVNKLHKRGIRFIVSGDTSILPERIHAKFNEAQKLTRDNDNLVLNIAVNYSGRQEIVDAVREVHKAVLRGDLKIEELTEEFFKDFLYHPEIPYPDLLIRTSGEYRISNFLLWQCAYTELWFSDSLWPEFSQEEYIRAIVDYQTRERRFGKVENL